MMSFDNNGQSGQENNPRAKAAARLKELREKIAKQRGVSSQAEAPIETTSATTPTVSTDQEDYAPGSTATFTASGFAQGEVVEFSIEEIEPGANGILDNYGSISQRDNAHGDLDLTPGVVVVEWEVPPDPDGPGPMVAPALDATLELTAEGQSSGLQATTTFTDSINPAPIQVYYSPLPEEDVRNFFDELQPTVSNTLVSITSITVSNDGTLIYYDQGENGFDADIANPDNIFSAGNPGGTQIWGDGDLSNGAAPGIAGDVLSAGDVIILNNLIDAVNPGNNPADAFNGGDKFASTGSVAVQRLLWPTSVSPGNRSTVLAGAVEVFDTFEYGTAFTAPIGENSDSRGGNSVFEEVRALVTATEDGTEVFLNGVSQGIINEGESLVAEDVAEGAKITTSAADGTELEKPVEVYLLTGDIDGNFESRWYRLTRDSDLGNDYYSPVTVKSGAGAARQIEYFVHNPTDSDITVNWQGSGTSSGSFTVAAGATEVINTNALPTGGGSVPLPTDSAIRFFTNDSDDLFSVVAALDVPASDPDGRDYDWGFTLLDEEDLTTRFQAGFAFGSANPDGTLGSGNGGPIWVTAIADTTITVDWDGDLSTVGDQQNIAVNALESVQLFDTVNNDNDQSGALVFTTDGTLITGAYGEDASASGIADPFIDFGYTIRPLPALDIEKATNGQDADSPTGPILSVGETATFTYEVENGGGVPLINVVVTDDNGTPGDTSDDFNPTFTGGDTNNNGELDPYNMNICSPS